METIKFKTDIKCAGCIAKATPYLNEVAGEHNWQVDINDPSKILTVNAATDVARLKDAVSKAGFKVERL